MFVAKTVVNLATGASPINNNLALQIPLENNFAASLAIIQDGHINVVPILSTNRHAKYIPVLNDQRDKGFVKQVKWVEIGIRQFFVVVSTQGVQVYDSDACDILFHHCLAETGDQNGYAVGICLLDSNVLVVGTHVGTVWMFKYDPSESVFTFLNRVYAHDEAVLMLDGSDTHMVSTSTDMTYLWNFKKRDFSIIRKFAVPGIICSPSSLKLKFGFVLIAYRSGEFCIFDVNKEEYEVRVTAHKLQITGIDFAANFLIATVSDDCFLKIWKFHQESEKVQLLQTIKNEEGPLYGVGFLDHCSTELCTVTGRSTKVNIYINWEENLTNIKSD